MEAAAEPEAAGGAHRVQQAITRLPGQQMVADLHARAQLANAQQRAALTSDGLNLVDVRRVLELQEQTRALQAEI